MDTFYAIAGIGVLLLLIYMCRHDYNPDTSTEAGFKQALKDKMDA